MIRKKKTEKRFPEILLETEKMNFYTPTAKSSI